MSTHGRRRHGRWCWVRFAPAPLDEHGRPAIAGPQVGFAIGKKIGSAVVRNRIRRRLRPILRSEDVLLPPGCYLIGVKNDQAASISHEMLQDDLCAVLAAVTATDR